MEAAIFVMDGECVHYISIFLLSSKALERGRTGLHKFSDQRTFPYKKNNTRKKIQLLFETQIGILKSIYFSYSPNICKIKSLSNTMLHLPGHEKGGGFLNIKLPKPGSGFGSA